MAPLRECLGAVDPAPIDQAFDDAAGDSLAAADRLAALWLDWLPPPGDPDRLSCTAYIAIQAIARYLSDVTHGPSVRCGALRQVAAAALGMLNESSDRLASDWLHEILDVFEHLVDSPEALLDHWLLRVEQALDLTTRLGTDTPREAGAPTGLAALLRGDERIEAELSYATTALERGISREHLDALLSRCARARGSASRALRATLHQDDGGAQEAVDVHWSAVLAAPYGLTGHLALSCAFFTMGRDDDGFTAACRAILHAGSPRRTRCLSALEEVWPTDYAVPFDLDGARATMESTDHPATRARCLEWLHARDPADVELAESLCRLRIAHQDPRGAIRVLSRARPMDAPRCVARWLGEDGQTRRAAAAWRYACESSRGLEDALELGAVAWSVGDDVAAVEAFERAYAITSGALFPAQLNALAMALVGVGEYSRCIRIARTLLDSCADPRWQAFGMDAMARASLGKRRFGAALRWAE
ncbi:MAG: hypothetical protein QF464_17715, partial [Myxococcota bacterium]|nr:hypothetical protein [Myxococcota bacterium]